MNFKKQMQRVKLKADQTFGRANKSEVLTDELLQIEKRLELTRTACSSVYKRISQTLQSSGPDLDKRLKKLPETAVANAMLEASFQLTLDTESALQKSLSVCAEAETLVAKERALYEMFVEGHVVDPLHSLVETDIPNIQKLRERLKRLVLDRDSAHQAWQKSYKAQYHPGVNIPQMTAKADVMKDELDAAISRMEICKDQLITELFDFLSKEGAYAQHITDFVGKELEYHRRCVTHLENLEPKLKDAQAKACNRSSYGTSLVEHLRVADREIAMPIETCISCLLDIGMYEEGLFRIAGGAAKLKKFRSLADAGVPDMTVYDAQDDIHAVAGTLKQYLRELPDPLLTQALYNDWLGIASITDSDAKLQETWSVIDRLPTENKANLRYLMKFCAVLAERQEYNKMSAGNIALVLAPNLLWAPNDDITANMMVSNSVASILENMIMYVDYFFPGEPEFKTPPPPQNDRHNAHGRSASAGSVGDATTIANSGVSHTQASPKSPAHSRNSSADTNVVLNSNNGDNTLQRSKKKKAAPAPPPGGPSRTSPTPISTDSTANKPPVAVKRFSTKRPNMPPPARPGSSINNGPESSPPAQPTGPPPQHSGPKPVPRPKPPVRKKPPSISESHVKVIPDKPAPSEEPPPPPIQEEETDGPVDASAQEEIGPTSPQMPDLPPPPLPSELDSLCGPGLMSELSSAPVVTAPVQEESDEDEREFIVTPL